MPLINIVGGGIFGAGAALALRRRGWSVALFDPGPLPHPRAASTDISKVIRMDYGEDDFYLDWMAEVFPMWDEWNARWPRPLYHQTGIIFITSSPMEPGGFEYESFIRLQKRGAVVDRLDAGAIAARFPAWNSARYIDGYYNPRAGWAESGAVVAQLIDEARANGVEIHTGEAFTGLVESGEHVTGLRTTDGKAYYGDAVLIAAGSWTAGLLPSLEKRVWPTGQFVYHLAPKNFEAYLPPQFPVWGADIHSSGWYGFPATDRGIVKIANHGPGWLVDPREQSEVPPDAVLSLRRFLNKSIPGLIDAPEAYNRLCFYSDSFDGDFWIDQVPGRTGLFVSTRDSGHAFKFAPGLGELIADVVEGKLNRRAARFAWREPKNATGEVLRK